MFSRYMQIADSVSIVEIENIHPITHIPNASIILSAINNLMTIIQF
jgi:hypothetical protein